VDETACGVYVEDSLCPICGKPNECSMSNNRESGNKGSAVTSTNFVSDECTDHGCWCMTTEFPKNYTKYIPAHAIANACVCQACIEKIANNEMPPQSL